MEQKIILVQLHSGGRVKFIILECIGDTVVRTWGLINGKTQTTSNTYDYINKGKANELSPIEAAEADFNRLIETKVKEGYIEVDDLDNIPSLEDPNMDFDNLPAQFCCSKPHNSVKDVVCNKLIESEKAKFFIKENGSCHYALISSDDEVKIYTRRMDDCTVKYPKLVEAIKGIEFMPKTLLALELCVDSTEEFDTHIKRFKRFQRISKSDTVAGKVKDNITKTLGLQEETPVFGLLFNILFLDGEDYTTRPYRYILKRLKEAADRDITNTIRAPEEVKFNSYSDAIKWVENDINDVEGLVLWKMDENAEITYNGKPNRRACYKVKAVREDDVIAYGWLEGTGAKQGKVGSLLIGKYNKEGTEIIPMGRVGSGLKIKQGECEIDYWDFPCVIEINYDQRFETGNYQFPRYIKRHEDKLPIDVVVDEDGF